MTDSPAEHPPIPPDTDKDPILGQTTGKILVFHHTHGFIRTVDFGSIFVHISNIEERGTQLEAGQHVRARIREGARGRYADQVQLIRENPAAARTTRPDATRPTDPAPTTPLQQYEVVLAVAMRLGEQETEPLTHIRRLIKHLGPATVWDLVAEAEQIEAQGGMLIPNGTRRRTFGGVFFALARTRLTPEDCAQIFPPKYWHMLRAQRSAAKPTPTLPAPPPIVTCTWALRGPLIDEAKIGQGRATSVKVTLIGRPESVVERGNTVVLVLTYLGPLPAMPKGVPVPSVVPKTIYTVYVGAKQWRGVAEAIQNPEDSLIIEGAQAWDDEHRAIAVYTTKIVTKLQQRAKRPAPPTEPTPPK